MQDEDRRELCHNSLTGLSVGDALGAQYFVPGRHSDDLVEGRVPVAPWEWTDDTEMACSVAAQLRKFGTIDQDLLAEAFAQRCEPYRGYGPGAVVLLHRIRDGVPWRTAAPELFDGQGSCGNGAAMRVAPLGAYFADEPQRVAEEAARSAEVTHSHPEGIAGAVAVALAAGLAGAARWGEARPSAMEFLTALTDWVGRGEVRDGVRRARDLFGRGVEEAAYELGNGSRVTAQDTVPFCVWVAATHLDDYPAAVTACVRAGGDIDTTAAIVGGIVAAYTGIGDQPEVRGVPRAWLAAREPLPDWAA
ncbi:ADP-ribosylglycohydrolase family protein [Micromonospora polyrhachis]|uniref:ADP-ribosylglycohydrolase n=1 Tax=Micromonospora polyrhachis TaxID=1282883 RepID=A0A7W7STV7_9ACTN|nr:ADP-ribosylglycohydrolase family protein [Micromonospora polyrhachis]MBB4960788.1 ADP-ribosylglycohydrolase [Micromonospora polyrhachis]